MADLEKPSRIVSIYEQMSTEDLQEIVRLDLYSSDTDYGNHGYILQVLEVLAKRRKESLPDARIETAAAWESFEKNYLPCAGSEGSIYGWDEELGETPDAPIQDTEASPIENGGKSRKRHILRYGVAAALLIIALSFFFSYFTLGISIWQSFTLWTRETIGFSRNAAATVVNEDTESLQKKLAGYGITEQLLPTWLPDGYKLTGFTIDELPEQLTLIAFFRDGDKALLVQIASLSAASVNIYEKDAGDGTQYKRNDIIHYIVSNDGKTTIVWTVGNFECVISGDISEDEAEKIINSIYER